MGRPVNGPPLQRLAPDDDAQLIRLDAYRASHPEWVIKSGTGFWQARRGEASGETVITRYSLPELLDVLDALAPPPH
jgi:hypothetical protein